MSNSQYGYHESKTTEFNDNLPPAPAPGLGPKYFFCNSLEEKRKYIYYRKGDHGTSHNECGKEKFKLRKSLVSWEFVEEKICSGKKLKIWKVFN